jgi:hypothetical protein
MDEEKQYAVEEKEDIIDGLSSGQISGGEKQLTKREIAINIVMTIIMLILFFSTVISVGYGFYTLIKSF